MPGGTRKVSAHHANRATPFPLGFPLLYVVLTLAWHKTILLLFGSALPTLVASLASLASPSPLTGLP